VAEAIRDKRDRYYEDMQVELAKIFGLHRVTRGRPKRSTRSSREGRVMRAAVTSRHQASR
jgi:hypothetical protein